MDYTLGSLQLDERLMSFVLKLVLFGLLILILTIGLLSTQISLFIINRIAIIVLLLSGVLAFHAMWLGLLGSGVAIFNGLFQVTEVTEGIDLFIYIVSILVLLMSETRSYKLQLNKEELNSSSNVEENIIGDYHQRDSLKALEEYPLILLFSILGITFLISSYDLFTIFLSIELQSFALYILATIFRDSESAVSAGLKYFLLGNLASAIILFGVGFVYINTGLTSFEGLYILGSTTIINQYFEFSVLLIIIGLLFKVAAAPYHN